jgi:hypothetical protein
MRIIFCLIPGVMHFIFCLIPGVMHFIFCLILGVMHFILTPKQFDWIIKYQQKSACVFAC